MRAAVCPADVGQPLPTQENPVDDEADQPGLSDHQQGAGQSRAKRERQRQPGQPRMGE
jgi:hypothetical protein